MYVNVHVVRTLCPYSSVFNTHCLWHFAGYRNVCGCMSDHMVLYTHSHDSPEADLCSALVGAGPARAMGERQGCLSTTQAKWFAPLLGQVQ